MFDKQIDFFYGDNNSNVLELIHPGFMIKTANSSEYSEELKDYIANLKAKVDKAYALVNAMGAYEYYGANRNGDAFKDKVLEQYHKTFEALAHIYKHHQNKNPMTSMGKVSFSHYNPKMKRVELILELDKLKAKDILDKLEKGELPYVSMGCRVAADQCSICGNKAKNRGEYCEHLKTQMGKILPDGRKVFAFNPDPKFFDISIVTIPADPTAGFLKMFKDLPLETNISTNVKKASVENPVSEHLKIAAKKEAEITKKVPGEIVLIGNKSKLDKVINNKKLPVEKLAEYPLNEVLSTCIACRIFPSKEEFQKLSLYSLGQKDLADELENKNIVFDIKENNEFPDDISIDNANTKIAKLLSPYMEDRALIKEYIVSRNLIKEAMFLGDAEQIPTPRPMITNPNMAYSAESASQMVLQPDGTYALPQPPAERSLIGRAFFGHIPDPPLTPNKNPIIPLGILGTLYYGYAKAFSNPNPNSFRGFMLKNPWLLPIIVGGSTLGALWAEDKIMEKRGSLDTFVRNAFIGIPVSYIYGTKKEYDMQQGKPISTTGNFVREHPLITGLVAALIGSKLESMVRGGFKKVAELVYKLPEEKVDILYKEFVY